MAGEQTWPTEEEMAEAAAGATNGGGKKEAAGTVKRKPKGWSDYQAAWIPDSDSDEYNSDEDDEDDDEDDDDEEEDGGMDMDMDGGGGGGGGGRSRRRKKLGDKFGEEAEMREGGGKGVYPSHHTFSRPQLKTLTEEGEGKYAAAFFRRL